MNLVGVLLNTESRKHPLVTIKVLNFQKGKMFAAITLKFKQRDLSIEKFVLKLQTEWPDLGLHC